MLTLCRLGGGIETLDGFAWICTVQAIGFALRVGVGPPRWDFLSLNLSSIYLTKLIKKCARNEPLTFAEWLFLSKCYLDSEARYYPIQEGYTGKAMLINVLNELSHGVNFERVLERYKLKRKWKAVKIFDKRKSFSRVLNREDKLVSILEWGKKMGNLKHCGLAAGLQIWILNS